MEYKSPNKRTISSVMILSFFATIIAYMFIPISRVIKFKDYIMFTLLATVFVTSILYYIIIKIKELITKIKNPNPYNNCIWIDCFRFMENT
ncbi:hypothetical protein K9L67_02235 [Candidatus Woesearchaeota archaeon]|nr:hypothetical protein [Candidatus Woesearchaeota archaeon]MCF7901023.1 hypothetical protein [Candidatus Woesearchaeota archaeon]MCF8013396.1 hypothetical protein [Candidatus Woesearchaeota archaeon]